MSADDPKDDLTKPGTAAVDKAAELPVVARLVIEIRSDGSRTIARGAMEDVSLGQKVAVEAEGSSPATLAAALLRSLAQVPFRARGPSVLRNAVKALLPKKPK